MGEQVLLTQELQRKLDQEATDLLQLLLSQGWVVFVQTRHGQVTLQLLDAVDVAGRQAAEDLKEEMFSFLKDVIFKAFMF